MSEQHRHRTARRSHRTRRVLIGVGVVIVLAVAALIVIPRLGKKDDNGTPPVSYSSTPSTARQSYDVRGGPPVPKTGAYVGAWVVPKPFSQPGRVDSVERFERSIGAQLRFVHLYRKWDQAVGTESDLAFAERGSYLLLSWATPDLNTVVNGSQDKLIAERARQIKALPTQVFLEIRWEMDRPNLRSLVHSPATYIAAWKHIQAIFAEQGVHNVAWTWCPTAGGFDNGTANAYYPGDSAVDWICADIYPKTPWVKGKYEPFPTLAQAFMTWAAGHPTKPIIVGEYGVGVSYGARRAQWITEAAQYFVAHPQIKAVGWFDEAKDDVAYNDLTLTDSASLAAYSKFAQTPYFKP